MLIAREIIQIDKISLNCELDCILFIPFLIDDYP